MGPTCESGHIVHRSLTVDPASAAACSLAGADPTTPPADQPPHCRSVELTSSIGPSPATGRDTQSGCHKRVGSYQHNSTAVLYVPQGSCRGLGTAFPVLVSSSSETYLERDSPDRTIRRGVSIQAQRASQVIVPRRPRLRYWRYQHSRGRSQGRESGDFECFCELQHL